MRQAIGVDGDGSQARASVEESVLGHHRTLMGRDDGQMLADGDVGFDAQGMADPAHPDPPDVQDALEIAEGDFGHADKLRVDGVRQLPAAPSRTAREVNP